MKKTAIFTFLLFLATAALPQDIIPTAPNLMTRDKNPKKILPVTVEYPHQNTRIAEGAKGIFLFGKVHAGGGLLTINGVDVPIYRTGTWLTYLPVNPGDMDFIIEFTDSEKTHKYKRSVFVRGFNYKDYLKKPRFDTSSLFPASDVELSENDILDFTVAGTPNMVVKMSAGDYFQDELLIASQREPGIYKKTVNFANVKPSGKSTKVTYYMYDDNGKLKAKASTLGKIKILPQDQASKTAKVIKEDSRLRPTPQPSGHILDTKLYGSVEVTGRINNLYRVKLDENAVGWIERRFLSPDSSLKKPRNIAWEISAAPEEDKTVLTIKNTEKVSFKVDENHDSFDVTLYYTQALNTIMSDSEDELLAGLDYEIVSDGAKSDSANIQEIFAADSRIAVCDPVYPVYVDSNVMAGRTGSFDADTRIWSDVIYMPCTAENGFVPAFPEKTRGIPIGLHTVEPDQFNPVVEIGFFQFRIEKIVFEDHNLVQLTEKGKKLFRMKILLVRRVPVNPDQFADALGDDFADAFVKALGIDPGNFEEAAAAPDVRSQNRQRIGQVFQRDKLAAVEYSDLLAGPAALELQRRFGTHIAGGGVRPPSVSLSALDFRLPFQTFRKVASLV